MEGTKSGSTALPKWSSNLRMPSRDLRNGNTQLLDIPNGSGSNTFGDRAFQTYAPQLWNRIPARLRTSKTTYQFRKGLKTHLFTKYYD